MVGASPHLIRPTYAGANMGTRTERDARCVGLRVKSLGARAVESHISRKTSEMWGTRVRW